MEVLFKIYGYAMILYSIIARIETARDDINIINYMLIMDII